MKSPRGVVPLQNGGTLEIAGRHDLATSGDQCTEVLDGVFLPPLSGMVKEFLSSTSLADILPKAIVHLMGPLPSNIQVSLELDGRTYGASCEHESVPLSSEDVNVSGRLRGQLILSAPKAHQGLNPAQAAFIKDAVSVMGALIQLHENIEGLTRSESKHRQLAANLAKEMWNRTEALAKETSYLEGMLRSCDDMIITTDLDSRIVEFNHGAEQILGFSAEDMQGRPVDELWEDTAARARILEEVTNTGGIRNYQTRLKTKSGGWKEISLTLSLLKDEEGRILGTVGVSKDITREKEIFREIERLNQNYRETIHFINHESKNSLIVIGGFIRRLLETEKDPARKEQLAIVYHHSKFLEAMSRDFLLMAELEHGEFKIRKELIRDFYGEVILPAMIGLKERYPDSFQSYDVSMGGVGETELYGDRNLLEVVYRNLFGNALKYRYPDGKISYGVEATPCDYVFNVWNEGPGVSPDQAERIFTKFYRADDDHTRQKRGTGLGLYNIRRIIEAHGGQIRCESVPGVSINFVFTLPRAGGIGDSAQWRPLG